MRTEQGRRQDEKCSLFHLSSVNINYTCSLWPLRNVKFKFKPHHNFELKQMILAVRNQKYKARLKVFILPKHRHCINDKEKKFYIIHKNRTR